MDNSSWIADPKSEYMVKRFVLLLISFFLVVIIVSHAAHAGSEPSVETGGTFFVGMDYAVIYGSVEDMGGEDELKLFIRYGDVLEGGYTDTENKTITSEGTFTYELGDLEYDTAYFFRAMLHWEGKEIDGGEKNFITEKYIPMDISTLPAEEVGYDSAAISAEVTDLEVNLIEAWFEWREAENSWNKTDTVNITDDGTFKEELHGLEKNTTYEFTGFAEWEHVKIEGGTRNFTTGIPRPVVTDIHPSHGSENLDIETEIGANVTYPTEDTVNISFYDGTDGSVIHRKDGFEGGWFSVQWENIEHGQSYRWYIEVDYPYGTMETDTKVFRTIDEEKLSGITEGMERIEGQIKEANSWVDDYENRIETDKVEEKLRELEGRYSNAENYMEKGEYTGAKEIIENTKEVEIELRQRMDELEEEADAVDRVWIIGGVVVLVAVLGAMVYYFISFIRSESSSKKYRYKG